MSIQNQCRFEGRLTKEPETGTTQSGVAWVRFTLAVDNGYRKGDEWVDDTLFIDCSAFRGTAEYIKRGEWGKGDYIGVVGELKQRNWEDKSGARRVSLSLSVVQSKRYDLVRKGSTQPTTAPAQGPQEEPDDDLPF